jgi:hypothetical protein
VSGDRNERARLEFAAKAARRQFAQQAEDGQITARDRFGRVIAPGALVLWTPPYPLIYEVLNVTPLLDPRVPPGLVQIVLTATAPLNVAANQAQIGLVVVGRQRDGHAEVSLPEGPEPAAPEEAPEE